MPAIQFFLRGEPSTTATALDIPKPVEFEALQRIVASHFGVVIPDSVGFESGGKTLPEVSDVETAPGLIGVTIDGRAVREVPGPSGLPLVGNYLEGMKHPSRFTDFDSLMCDPVFPDHLGNNQRLFDKYGPIFKTTNLGKTTYQSNSPAIAQVAFAETEFFSKQITENHPLYPIKQDLAGVFLSDTSGRHWSTVHKFLPPALGPVRINLASDCASA